MLPEPSRQGEEEPDDRPEAGRALKIARRLAETPVLIYAALAALAFPILEMLVGQQGAVQYAHDVFDNELPDVVSITNDFRQFGFSLWDTHLTGGNALLSQFPTTPFTPDVLIGFVTGPFVAYFIASFLLVFLGGYGTHLFLRDSMRLPAVACYAGGILTIFNFWNYVYGFAIPLVPLSLWLADRLLAGPHDRRNWLAMVVLGTFELYAGGIQLVVLMMLLEVGYVLAVGRSSRRLLRGLSLLVSAWAVGFLLFAPVLFTQLVYLPISQRVDWDLTRLMDVRPLPVLWDRITFYATTLVGVPAGGIPGTADVYGTYFLGALALPFVVLGMLTRGKSPRERFLLALLLALPVIDYLLVVATPLQMDLGIIKSFQFVRIRHFAPFLLDVMAALGVAAVARSGLRAAIGGRVRGAVFWGAVGLLVVEAGYACVKLARAAARTGTDHRTLVGWVLATSALAFVAAWVAVAVFMWRRRNSTGVLRLGTGLALILLVALVGERVLYVRAERDLNGGLGTYSEYMTEDPAQAFIAGQANPDFDRTMTAGADTNTMLIAGLMDVGGYETAYPATYHDLFGVLTDPYLDTNPDRWIYYHDWGNRAYVFGPKVSWPIADLMGVKWVYARGMTFDDTRLTSVYTWQDVTVYRNSAVFPRAFVVDRESCYAAEDDLLSALAKATDADLRAQALGLSSAGCDSSATAAPTQAAANPTASIVGYAQDEVRVNVDAGTAGLLVLTDTYAPGWTATVDGKTVEIDPVDAAYRGVRVPAGKSVVVFSYRPVFTYAGFAVAGATAFVLVATGLVFLALALRRRRLLLLSRP